MKKCKVFKHILKYKYKKSHNTNIKNKSVIKMNDEKNLPNKDDLLKDNEK